MNRAPSIASVIRDMARAKMPVRGVRLWPDGTVDLLTEAPEQPLAENDDTDWVNLAGASQVSGPSRP